MSTQQSTPANAVLAEGLRETADWLDAHPELPAFRAYISCYPYGSRAREVLSALADALGADRAEEAATRSDVTISGRFGDGAIRVAATANVRDLGVTEPVLPSYQPILAGSRS